MDEQKDIAFIRLDILDFARHFIPYRAKNDYEGAGREILSISDALVSLNPSINGYAAKLIEESVEFQRKKREAGRKGGLAKAKNAESRESENQQKQAIKPRTPQRPPTKENVYDFASEHSLDDADARDWYERNFVERDGCDRNGNKINNWQGALIRSCQAAKLKRERNEDDEL